MRKITKLACQAFSNGDEFKRENTQVRKTAGSIQMLLHGNLIAERTNNSLYISNCGWQTNITKERLNGLNGVRIYQKRGQWYLNNKAWNGDKVNVSVFNNS